MSKFKESMFGPVIVLLAICFGAGTLLSFTYSITAPIIEAQKKSVIEEVYFEGKPDAEAFIELDAETLPEGIHEAFVMPDKSYVVLKAIVRGWGGPVTYFIALDRDGKYIYIRMGDNTETPGLGNKVADPAYLSRYLGTNDPHGVAAVTGVTVTTNSLRAALALSNDTFKAIKGE